MVQLSFSEKQSVIAKILDNEFSVNADETVLTVNADGKNYDLDNETVKELVASGIHDRVERREGITAEQFYNVFGADACGYKVFRDPKMYKPGTVVTDPQSHGMYFTVRKEEVYRFLKTGYGDYIAVIGFKDENGRNLEDVHIAKGDDTPGTYKAHRFYVHDVIDAKDSKAMDYFKSIADEKYKFLK